MEDFETVYATEYKKIKDGVNHPAHYAGDIECIDAMVQQFGSRAVMDFCLTNAFKYIWRCNKKHLDPTEDIEEAIWYLNKYLELGAKYNG